MIRFAALVISGLALAACDDTTPTSGGPAGANPCGTIATCQSSGRGSGATSPLPAGDIARFAYVANLTDNTLSMFLVDAASGRLTPIGYVLTRRGPVAVATDPASKYVYVANRDDDSVSAFAVDERTGTLDEVTGSPITVGDAPATLLVDPSGHFLYVANQTGESISAFSITATTGALTLRETESTPGLTPTSLAVDSTGVFLFAGNSATGSNPANISSFSIDASTGELTAVDSVTVGQGAIALAMDPGGARVYAVSDYQGEVAVVSVTAGNLSVDDPATVTAGSGGSGIVIAPSGTAAYVTNRTNAVVQDYAVDGAGAFSAISGSPPDTGLGPVGLTVDPLGERVYVLNANSADILSRPSNSA